MNRFFKGLLFLIFLTGWVHPVIQAQQHARHWYFGQGAGLIFEGRYPMPLVDSKMNAREGVATQSDSLGNLLFYTDGQTVWNLNHEIIADNLAGDPSSTMSATVLPNRMHPDQYFLFTTGRIINENGKPVVTDGGHYYLLDFSAENPGGKIIADDQSLGTGPLQPNSVEKILGIPYPQQIIADTLKNPGYWMITHAFDQATFRISEFENQLLAQFDITVGRSHENGSGDFGANKGASGYMAVSLQGDKVAVAIEGQQLFQVFNFDRETGQLRLTHTLPAGEPGLKKDYLHDAYGVAFSPSGRFLYGTARDEGILYQWDLFTPNVIEETNILRHKAEKPCGALQLAPNGRMYVAVNGGDYVGVINRPDRLGKRAAYEEFGARLIDNETGSGGTSSLGLPQFHLSEYVHKHFNYDHNCLGDTTVMYLTGSPSIGGYSFTGNSWTVLDPESGAPYVEIEIDDYLMGTWVFPHAGDYDILVKGRYNGVAFELTERMTIHEPPAVKLAGDYTYLCRGDSLVLDAGNGAFYEWTDESHQDRHFVVTESDFVHIPLQEYRVKVTDYRGCVGWDTVKVEIRPAPEVHFEYTHAVCDSATGSAAVIPKSGVDNYYYQWEDFPDNTSNKIEQVPGGDYVVYVTSKYAGCKSAKLAQVPELGVGQVSIESSASGTVCPGEQITLHVRGEGATDYVWIHPAGETGQTIRVEPTETSTYSVRVIASEGDLYCEKTVSLTIPVQVVLAPEMETSYDSCEGDTLELIAPEGFVDYQWSNGAVGRLIRLHEGISDLVLTVSDSVACTSSISLSAAFHPAPEVDLGEDRAVCTKDPIPLSGGEGQEYWWNTGADIPEISVSESGVYSLRIGDFGCYASDTVEIVIRNPDSLVIDSVNYSDVTCFGANDGEIELFVHGMGSAYQYSLDGGATYKDNGGLFTGLRPGYEYELAVKEDDLCVTTYPDPIQILEPEEISFQFDLRLPNCEECYNGSITVIGLSGGTEPYAIQWDTMESGSRLSGLTAGYYEVTITDANHCTKTEQVYLEMGFRIPDAFTPNGDGQNDYWEIKPLREYPASLVMVYDRSGREVFRSDPGYPTPWDGTFNGTKLSMGTYYYLIRLDADTAPLNGHLTLIR